MILTDTGPLVALVDKDQPSNTLCRVVLKTTDLPLLTTWPAFTEAMYLIGRIGGWSLQHNLWQYVENETLVFYVNSTPDLLRMRNLMEKYRDRPMDLADASLVVTAEVRGDNRIFTIDSDFRVYRLNGREHFEVIP